MSNFAVKETKELCLLAAKLVNAADKSLADGKISLFDAAHFLSPLKAANAAIQGIKEVPSELKDLSEAEAQELKEAIAGELDLSNDDAEVIVEQVIGVGLQLAAAVQNLRAKKALEAEAPQA